MNAQILRKWSPFKIFMYLWQIYFVLLFIFWWPGAFAMHLTPVNLTQQSRQQLIGGGGGGNGEGGGNPSNYQYHQQANNSNRNNNNNNNDKNSSTDSSIDSDSSNLLRNSIISRSSSSIDQNITHLHQIFPSILSPVNLTKLQLADENGDDRWNSLPFSRLQPDSSSVLSSSNNNNFVRQQIANERWHQRMNEKRARLRAHRRYLASLEALPNRHRRDSRHHNRLNPQRTKRKYCSARDPRALAFDAPTVFEGKVKSMTRDRRSNFSVTFECTHVYKQPSGYKVPENVRLQFQYQNQSQCDIYREEYRQRGFVRDEIELGSLYFLFVKQIDVGNFTILGQPIRKTKRTEKDVRIGANSTYGEYQNHFFFLF